MTRHAFGYLRVSGDGQISGTGYDRQRETILEWCLHNGTEVVVWYSDAYTGTEADRPELMRALSDMLDNGCRTLIVENLERFARDLLVQTTLLAKIESLGLTLISASTGEDVTASVRDDPMRKALVQIQGVFAELDKSLLVRKLARGKEIARGRGRRTEGPAPSGEVPSEVETLERIKDLYRKPKVGKRRSFSEIAKVLNQEGRPTRSGRPWNRGTVYAIVQRWKAD